MADKYAHQHNPPPRERVANILGCRMSWSLAETCADDLDRVGLPSTDRAQAIAILAGHLGRPRAVAVVRDLANSGLVPRAARLGED